MKDATRPPAFFLGEDPALDFLNSVAQPKTDWIDWLESGPALLDWLRAAQLITVAQYNQLSETESVAALELAAADIRAFRETLRPIVMQLESDVAHTDVSALVAVLNAEIAKLQFQASLTVSASTDTAARLQTTIRIERAADLLPRICFACAEFLAREDLARLKNCDGPTCTLLFVDTTKNHRRRWCSMEVCGNRAKAAAHRQRGKS